MVVTSLSRVCSIQFYDELSQSGSSVDSEGDSPAQPMPDFSIKVLHLSGLSVEVGSLSLDHAPLNQSCDGEHSYSSMTWLYNRERTFRVAKESTNSSLLLLT